MNAKTIVILCSICFIVGAGISAGVAYSIANGYNRQLDNDLRTSRADFDDLSSQYRAIEQSNIELGKRLDSVASGIAEAKRLAGQLSIEGESVVGQIRRVIENLRKIKGILENLPVH